MADEPKAVVVIKRILKLVLADWLSEFVALLIVTAVVAGWWVVLPLIGLLWCFGVL
jgi:hypothetical protein